MLCVFAPYINPTKTSLNTSQNPYKPFFSSNSTHTLTTLSRTYQPIGAPQRPTVMELTQHNKIFTLAAKETRLSQSQDRQPTTGVIRRTHRQGNRNNQQKKRQFLYLLCMLRCVAYALGSIFEGKSFSFPNPRSLFLSLALCVVRKTL